MYMGGRAHVGKFFIFKIFFSRHALYRPCGWPPPDNRPYQNWEKSGLNQAQAWRHFKVLALQRITQLGGSGERSSPVGGSGERSSSVGGSGERSSPAFG